MDSEKLAELVMTVEHPEEVAEILSALDTVNRVRTFHMLYQGTAPKQIAEELDVTRSALQPYLTDFKETGLVRVDGKEYVFTEKGRAVYELLEKIDNLHRDLTELQEFLVENPEVVPEEVLDEIKERRKEK